jgi:GntR family transcriptional regulator
MILRLNPASGIPLYLQLIEQVKHAIETGAIRAGEQLPSVRQMAEDLLINPNTVAHAYRELEHEGIIELRHGSGAFIRESMVARARLMQKAQTVVQSAIERLEAFDLTEDEIRRLVENELALRRANKQMSGANASPTGRSHQERKKHG